MKRVLVISPHPDDEVIGCGSTLRKHILEGDKVDVIFLTSGEQGGHGRSPEDTLRIREQEANAAAHILNINKTEFWREPDGALRVTQRIVDRLCKRIKAWPPHLIYVPHDQEEHPDHRASVRLIRRVLDKLPKSVKKPSVWMFEIWTPMQRMDHIVDISSYLDVKRKAIRAYQSQCAVMKFEEAILGLNRYRGEMHSWPGGDYAEVFVRMNP